MSNFDVVIFDFDGTIADTSPGVLNCIKHMAEFYNLEEKTPQQLRKIFGPPLANGFKDLFNVDDEMAKKLVEKYRELYNDNEMYNLVIYDGMRELFKTLKDNGIKLGIASSKPEAFFGRLLEKFEIKEYFDSVCGADMHFAKNEKNDIIERAINNLPECPNERILMVGDTVFDINGAKHVGIVSVGVLFGFGEKEELEAAGADYLVSDTKELEKLILG